MFSITIRSAIAMCGLFLASYTAADTLVEIAQPSTASVESSTNANKFVYPASTLVSSDFIETGVLFVYDDHILNYFNGDSEKLLTFINANIEHNNQAFINSNIPLKRVVTGLVRVENDEIWSSNNTYTERLHALADWQRSEVGEQLKRQHQNSYLVSLAGFQESEGEITMVGQAYVGDNVSWISPFTTDANTWITSTLAHELGHNDGFKHLRIDFDEDSPYIARHDAAGYQCGAHGSIMLITGSHKEPFFSDAEISLEENNDTTACGAVGEANSAQVYRDLLKTTFVQRTHTFRNIQATRSKTGVVSIHQNVSAALEGYQVEFDIIFEGADTGDSVNYIARQGSADLHDFTSVIGSITHDGINNVYTIVVPILTDNIDEAIEQFSIELVYPNGVTIDQNNASVEMSIFDKHDSVGYVEFSSSQMSVEEGQSAEITIVRVGGSEGEITYQVETFIGSANHADFESTSQSLTFAHGEMSKTLSIKTMTDNNVEPNETFKVKIIQTLHPVYITNTIKSEMKVTIENPVASNNIANSTAVSAGSPLLGASSEAGESAGGSLHIACLLVLLTIAVRRKVR